MDLDALALRLAALGNPTRLAAFRALVRAGPAGLATGALQARLGLPASTLTHHLAHLLKVGLVTQERHGTTLICRADFEGIDAVVTSLRSECCADMGQSE
ncbi:ArsR/SmtB family transcription factor [Palleronia sp. KMU-117]|uniref:ArsR/SmtB family transcription factor n=1 Tax=Palleronia sp. KMU-117 TaxID=3434108 RepID=UPI003D72BF4E